MQSRTGAGVVVGTTFRRAPDFERRSDMIEATLDCIADMGIQATTVRAVAARAGVSNGLIRHHFISKSNLIIAAYRRTIEMMMAPALAVLATREGTPHERLIRFIAAALAGPVTEPRLLALWAAFISQLHIEREIARAHREGYLAFRRAIAALVADVLAAEGRASAEAEQRRLAIAITALMDGLWLEGIMSADDLDEGDLIATGLHAIETLLGVKLPGLA